MNGDFLLNIQLPYLYCLYIYKYININIYIYIYLSTIIAYYCLLSRITGFHAYSRSPAKGQQYEIVKNDRNV